MDSHQTRRLLRAEAGLSSRLGLGTHALHWLFSGGARQGLLRLAYDLGIRHFDTAPSYGAGLAEREIGRFCLQHRSNLVIATKFGLAPGRLAASLPGGAYLSAAAGAALRALRLRRPASGAPVGDFSAAAMQHSVEDSLRRLRMDYIDVLYLHAPRRDSLGNVEPLLEALASLRQAGKVRRVGISGLAAECVPIARGYPELAEMLQIELLADSHGLPDIVSLPPATAVASWELPGSRAPATGFTLSRHFERLQRALPAGLVLLSTPDGRAIRQASDFFSQQLSGAGA